MEEDGCGPGTRPSIDPACGLAARPPPTAPNRPRPQVLAKKKPVRLVGPAGQEGDGARPLSRPTAPNRPRPQVLAKNEMKRSAESRGVEWDVHVARMQGTAEVGGWGVGGEGGGPVL
jgi:hypothetical protein